ncbi:TRAP transporter substrate-binding protein [Alteribacillus sp. HJP-4]|uniref:TRAP transporter substrate-binding protein n=1 Tax=Alteribacillus sp. HJP-4 TaxID=2775394 RepID=UPI0035CCF8FE
MKKTFLFLFLFSIIFIVSGCLQLSDGDENGGTEDADSDDEQDGASDEADAESEYVIEFAHVVTPSTAKGEAAEHFGELLEERTDGRMTVEIYPDSQLGSDREITEQMQSGTIQMNAPFTGVLPSFVPQYQVFDLPFLFDDRDHAFDSVNGELADSLNEYLTDADLRALGYWDGGFKHFTNSERPIESVEDMEGLSMRVSQSPLLTAQFDSWGAGGTSIDFSELYTALQQGTVDGQENPLSNIVSQNFYEVQDYMTYSAHGYMGYALLISESYYQELPEDLQEAVTEVAQETSEWQWEQSEQKEEEYAQTVEESDMEVTELTEEAKQGFIDASEGVYDQYVEEVEGGQEILDTIE